MPRKTRMPGTIQLGGRRVALVLESPHLNMNLMGVHESWANRITLNSGMAPDQVRATAVHEILHDLDQLVGIGLDEQAVTSLASALFAALRDNPALVAWLMDVS